MHILIFTNFLMVIDHVTGLAIRDQIFFEDEKYSDARLPLDIFAFLGVPTEGTLSVDVTPRKVTFSFADEEGDVSSKVVVSGKATRKRKFSNDEKIVAKFKVRSIVGGLYSKGDDEGINIESITGARFRRLNLGDSVDPRLLFDINENPKIIVPGSLVTWGSGPFPFNSSTSREKGLGIFASDFPQGWWDEGL